MPPRDWRARLADILDASARIEIYIAGLTFEQFQTDGKTVDAVLRNLQVIGEAARHVPSRTIGCATFHGRIFPV